MAGPAWLKPLRRELDAAVRPRTFFFRDDDAGWADERLFALLDIFRDYAIPLDLAVIPAALEPEVAARLRRRDGPLAFHQHGLAHVNHEPCGRPCEFGPCRPARAQRADIAEGAKRLHELLGETEPIFTPPWNRCAATTGRCMVELGFRALARDASAEPLGVPGLQELAVNVDWPLRRKGCPLGLERSAEVLAGTCTRGVTGVMLHHALLGPEERRAVEQLLALLASHANAQCILLADLVAACDDEPSLPAGRTAAGRRLHHVAGQTRA